MLSWTKEVLPFVAMLMVTCLDMSMLILVKAALNDGLNCFVYLVYGSIVGTLVLVPIYIIHIFRMSVRPKLTRNILFRFFILGLLGACLFPILLYLGIGYSSPLLASAASNLIPANTFLLAVVFGMEKIDLGSSNSRAKLFGTIIAISGAMVFTFYKGPEIFQRDSTSDSHNELLLSQASDWILGGLILVINGIVGSSCNVLQSATSREYPDQATIIFYYSFFGTIQSIILSLFLVKNPSDWVLQPGIQMICCCFRWGIFHFIP